MPWWDISCPAMKINLYSMKLDKHTVTHVRGCDAFSSSLHCAQLLVNLLGRFATVRSLSSVAPSKVPPNW